MNTTNRPKTGMERSRLDWSGNMQVIRKGDGEIAMTEGELARFFGVTWKKLNGKLQVIQKSSNLHLDEMCAGEKSMVRDNELTEYAPLYRSRQSSPSPFCWTAWKLTCSESMSAIRYSNPQLP